MNATLDHLHQLYANTDDPWDFARSTYEQQKFIATRNALTHQSYGNALELGCGNGALARHLAPLCARYTGLDAVERAVMAARSLVPSATFIRACYPCPLPGDGYDLIILSEVLYFMTPDAIAHLARDLARVAPRAEILCTTFLGDTELPLQGGQSLDVFRAAVNPYLDLKVVADTGRYRIDRGTMRGTVR